MRKILEIIAISDCLDCKHVTGECGLYRCAKMQAAPIPDYGHFPPWCPLEDYKEGD